MIKAKIIAHILGPKILSVFHVFIFVHYLFLATFLLTIINYFPSSRRIAFNKIVVDKKVTKIIVILKCSL